MYQSRLEEKEEERSGKREWKRWNAHACPWVYYVWEGIFFESFVLVGLGSIAVVLRRRRGSEAWVWTVGG
jgi:hypothetical protein